MSKKGLSNIWWSDGRKYSGSMVDPSLFNESLHYFSHSPFVTVPKKWCN